MVKAAKKSDLQQKSPAEFFAENKNIAGFDNVWISSLARFAIVQHA
jgi:DNA topoisomerase VI subunit B